MLSNLPVPILNHVKSCLQSRLVPIPGIHLEKALQTDENSQPCLDSEVEYFWFSSLGFLAPLYPLVNLFVGTFVLGGMTILLLYWAITLFWCLLFYIAGGPFAPYVYDIALFVSYYRCKIMIFMRTGWIHLSDSCPCDLSTKLYSLHVKMQLSLAGWDLPNSAWWPVPAEFILWAICEPWVGPASRAAGVQEEMFTE